MESICSSTPAAATALCRGCQTLLLEQPRPFRSFFRAFRAHLLTALPLVGFAYAVRRIPLTSVGLLQYIAPTLQFLIGVYILHEPFDRTRLVGFACIWLALAIFAGEGLLRSRGATAA